MAKFSVPLHSDLCFWQVADEITEHRSVLSEERTLAYGIFDERPWYGIGGYQFLAVVLILVASILIHRYFDDLD